MIGIITDSTCDIPDALIEQYGITIIPHYIIWGDEQFRDRVDMTPLEFYKRLEVDPVYSSSSQAGIPDFQKRMKKWPLKGLQKLSPSPSAAR